MDPKSYAAAWKRYVNELKGEGPEAAKLLKELKAAWEGFSNEQMIEAANIICGA